MHFTFETSPNRTCDINARVSEGIGAQLARYCSKQNIIQTNCRENLVVYFTFTTYFCLVVICTRKLNRNQETVLLLQ